MEEETLVEKEKTDNYGSLIDSTFLRSCPGRRRCSALWTQIIVSLAVSLLPMTGGIIFGYTGIVLPSLTDPDSGDIYLDEYQVPVYTSLLSVGSLLGNFVCGPLTIRYGQRVMLLLSMPLALIGWAMPYISGAFWLLLLSRIALGVVGAIAYVCPYSYITEIAHCRIRGRLMGLTDLFENFGSIFLYVVGSTTLNWRTVGLVCGLTPLVIPCIALLHAPNSSRWTAVKGLSKEQVIKSLRYFREEGHDLEAEYDDIKEDISRMRECSTTCEQIRLLKGNSIAKRFTLLIYLNLSIGFAGNASLTSYYVSIFKLTETGIDPYMSTILTGAMKLVGSLVYLSIADRFGRRPTFISSCSLAGFFLLALGLFFHLKQLGQDVSGLFWLPLTSVLSFTVAVNFYYSVNVVLIGELLPNAVRSFGLSILFFFLTIGYFIEALTFPIIASSIGAHWAFYIYATNSLLMVFVVYNFLPETKGKTLEEITNLFSNQG